MPSKPLPLYTERPAEGWDKGYLRGRKEVIYELEKWLDLVNAPLTPYFLRCKLEQLRRDV